MSPLAKKLYTQLRKRVVAGQHSITYAALARAAGNVHPRSPALHAALGEVANACRHAGVPVLPAIVWKAGANRPSTGYYKVAHPRAHTDEAKIAAWEREYARVVGDPAVYPASLEAG
jgi:hypothetical protein